MAKPVPGSNPILKLELDLALSRAVALRREDRIGEAAALCQQVLRSEPNNAGALHLLGAMALQTGATEIAVGGLGRAAALAPKSAPILADLGRALAAAGRHAEATSAFRKSLSLRPASAETQIGLAEALLDLGQPAEALRSYRKAAALEPANRLASHMVAALAGKPATDAYVPLLFDKYADTFDSHMAGALDYHVPERLREAVAGHAPFATALDLGCGTGLVGAALTDLAGAMDGIDISPKMISAATAKSLYRTLRAGDLVNVMASDPAFTGPYDLVAAADVFIYVGALEAVFAVVQQRLRPGGLFVFSVEEVEDGEVVVRSSGRFAHSRAYIADLAADGFTLLDERTIPIRKERNVPIPGRLYLFARS